ncbi:MAG: DegT/DnrJ/EryC1/StrS family aminotransferase [Methanogenium sp.]|nr:DegT/DnrJ/EryC1/StrS family aminotransferase [Methanogenium sp.]
MIPRIRPHFNRTFIDAVMSYDPDHLRSYYTKKIIKKISVFYPSAEFEFIDLGRNALGVALDILNINKGDEIILPCFTCSSVLEPIIVRGIIPKLVDINPDFTMNVIQIKEHLSKNTKAIVVTHFFSVPSNIKEICELVNNYSVYVIEDCANTFCADINGLKLGNIGDIAFTSFKNDKPLSLGKGSALIVNNNEFFDSFSQISKKMDVNTIRDEKSAFLSLLSFYYMTDESRYSGQIATNDYYSFFNKNSRASYDLYNALHKYPDVPVPKLNKHRCLVQHIYNRLLKYNPYKTNVPLLMGKFSLNLLCAAVDDINIINDMRMKNFQIYEEHLEDNSNIYLLENISEVPLLRYPLVCKNTKLWNVLKDRLLKNQVEVSNYNWYPSLDKILKIKGNFKSSNMLARNILNLPNHMYLSEKSIQEICDIINNCTKS